MNPYRPALAHRAIGQRAATFASGITSDIAKKIVQEADPATRALIRDERNRLAEALIGGIPFAAGSAIGAAGTYFLVPDGANLAKFAGYGASAAALLVGAWWTFSRLTEERPTAEKPAAPGIVTSAAAEAAKDIVREAEPKIRAIVQEEKAKAAAAAMAGLPLAVGSLAAFFATMFLVKPENRAMKTVGYSGSAILLGAGAWIALEKERETAA